MNTSQLILSSLLVPSLLYADLEHGSLTVTEPVSTANLTLGPDTTPGVSLPNGSNAGDYWFDFLPHDEAGVLLSSVTQLSRNGIYATASAYELTSLPHHFISVHRTTANVAEDDVNVAFAFFPIEDFLTGYAFDDAGVTNIPVSYTHLTLPTKRIV